jgi:hypothetical protein
MKIAVVSESLADEAAVKILVDAVLGIETELISARLRPRGWPSVLNLLPTILKHLHYNTDADGFVVVVDSDESPLHKSSHLASDVKDASCRLCQLQSTAEVECGRLRPVVNRNPINIAVGLAIPAIEAWYRCGIDPHVTEFEWDRRLQGERITYDKRSLKHSAYGSDRAANSVMTAAARQAAQRLTTNLDRLEQVFPLGFGSLLRSLRDW